MMMKRQDFYEQRAHLMRNIQLADNKAANILTVWKDEVSARNKVKLLDLFNKVINPVLVCDEAPSGYKPFALARNEDHLTYEISVLIDTLEEKYAKINDMIKIIR